MGGEFIVAIMVYYILIFGIKKYAISFIPHIFGVIGLVTLLVYVFWFPYKNETGERGMYGITTLFRWIPYFSFMLLGAWMGMKRNEIKFKSLRDFMFMVICLVLFYSIQLAAKKYPVVAPFQIVTLLPLMGLVCYFYKWCHTEFFRKLYNKRFSHAVIMTISGLCLESYLIQFSVFTTKMNDIFPFNIPIMIIVVLLVAFFCKCLSRLFSQTFRDGDYNWKEIVKLY